MTQKSPSTLYALRIAIPYLLISFAWILFSDRFVESMAIDVRMLTALQNYKGFFFITMSAILIYLTARHYLTRLSKIHQVIYDKELALAENQQGMFTLLSNLPGMAYLGYNDESRHMDFVSDGCMNLLGYDSKHFTCRDGASFVQIIIEDDREMVKHEISRAVRDKSAFQIEYRIRLKNGLVKWVSEQGCAIHSVAGREKVLVGYIFELEDATLRDTSHRRSQTRQILSPIEPSPAEEASQGLNIMSRRY